MMGILAREGLHHQWCAKDESFFKLIDETGGWPLGYQYVGFEHTTERRAGFCNSSHNTGYWTVLFCADDYYLWKLSHEAIARIADAAIRKFCENTRDHRPPVDKLRIQGWHGNGAVLSEKKGGAA